MCEGDGCPLKDNCYRHTATPNPYRQSYFLDSPYDSKRRECEHYWDNTPYKNTKKNKGNSNEETNNTNTTS